MVLKRNQKKPEVPITPENRIRALKVIADAEILLEQAEKNRIVIDPEKTDNHKVSWWTPELHAMMNLEGQLKSFFRNFTPSKETKTGKLMQYGWVIAIVIALGVFVMQYNDSNSMKQVINMMQEQIGYLQNYINNLAP